MIHYDCTGPDPFDLKCGKSAWKFLHPDLPESRCLNCGSKLVLSTYNSPKQLIEAYWKYVDEYNAAKNNPVYYPELANARFLPHP